MSSLIHNATEASFEADVLQSDRPVLVDFWAEWCGPCKALAPVLAEIAEAYGEDLKVVKVDVAANGRLAELYGARSIPLLVMFKGGVETARTVGAVSKTRLGHMIDQEL